MRRRNFLVLLAGAAAWTVAARAQQPPRPRRVGVLHPSPAAVANMRIAAFREGLVVPGSPDATDVDVIARIAGGNIERLPGMANELVGLGVEALLAVSPTAVRAARDATKSVPIIAVDLESDPVGSGWAASLARPGGNVTGVFLDLPEFSAKCLQLLRDTVPALSKMGILWDPAIGSVQLQAVQTAAAGLRVTLEVVEVGRVADFEAAFRAIVRSQAGAVLMLSSPLFSANPQLLATLCRQNWLPAINLFPDFAEKGGLMAYGPDLQALFRQAGGLTRKVLQGATPAGLPIERPTLFQFALNLRTAKELGLTIPDAILLRADQVIE